MLSGRPFCDLTRRILSSEADAVWLRVVTFSATIVLAFVTGCDSLVKVWDVFWAVGDKLLIAVGVRELMRRDEGRVDRAAFDRADGVAVRPELSPSAPATRDAAHTTRTIRRLTNREIVKRKLRANR